MSGAMIAGLIADTLNNVWGNVNESVSLGMQEKIAQQQLDLAEKQYYSNVDIMNKNFGLQQEAFNYNKQQAELTRLREDNAFQRRVKDYTTAGFSPLAAQGVAASSQSPALTAPQYDPQGVNNATTNRLNAYDKKMQVYQNKLNQSNINAEMRLKNMQLSLAQIETAKGIFESVYNTKKTGQEIRRLELENDFYSTHGFKDTTFQTLISDILKNLNFGGKTPGEAVADSINDIMNDSEKKFSDVITEKVHDKSRRMFIKNLESENKISEFIDLLNESKKGKFSFWAIDKAKQFARFNFGYDLNLKADRMLSLSDDEVKRILDDFMKYRGSLVKGGK